MAIIARQTGRQAHRQDAEEARCVLGETHFHPIDKSKEKSREHCYHFYVGTVGEGTAKETGQKHSRVDMDSKEYMCEVIPHTDTNLL